MRAALLLLALFTVAAGSGGSGRILKVLPHFLDGKGRHTLSPSLFERDAYQAELRLHPEQVTGIRYDVQWRAPREGSDALPVTVRVELRTALQSTNGPIVLESAWAGRKPVGVHWSKLALTGDAYRASGPVIAWRTSLLRGTNTLSEKRSFLW